MWLKKINTVRPHQNFTLAKRSWKKAISSYGCEDFTLEKVLSLAVEEGFHFIELEALEGERDLYLYFIKKYGSLEYVRNFLYKNDVRISLLNLPYSWQNMDLNEERILFRSSALAHCLEIPFIRVYAVSDSQTSYTDSDFVHMSRKYLRWEKEKNNCTWSCRVATEIDPTDEGIDFIEEWMNLSRREIPLIWDAGTAFRRTVKPLKNTWDRLHHLLVLVRVVDSVEIPSLEHSYSCVPPGLGEFPIQDLYSYFKKDCYRKFLSLKWGKTISPHLPHVKLALQIGKKQNWF